MLSDITFRRRLNTALFMMELTLNKLILSMLNIALSKKTTFDC